MENFVEPWWVGIAIMAGTVICGAFNRYKKKRSGNG